MIGVRRVVVSIGVDKDTTICCFCDGDTMFGIDVGLVSDMWMMLASSKLSKVDVDIDIYTI